MCLITDTELTISTSANNGRTFRLHVNTSNCIMNCKSAWKWWKSAHSKNAHKNLPIVKVHTAKNAYKYCGILKSLT